MERKENIEDESDRMEYEVGGFLSSYESLD